MAASAHKMVTLCAVLAIVLFAAGQPPAMADPYDYDSSDRSRVASCPGAATSCRAQCLVACDAFSLEMCDGVCRISQAPLEGLGQTCVNHALTICMDICKNLCEPLPVQPNTSSP